MADLMLEVKQHPKNEDVDNAIVAHNQIEGQGNGIPKAGEKKNLEELLQDIDTETNENATLLNLANLYKKVQKMQDCLGSALNDQFSTMAQQLGEVVAYNNAQLMTGGSEAAQWVEKTVIPAYAMLAENIQRCVDINPKAEGDSQSPQEKLIERLAKVAGGLTIETKELETKILVSISGLAAENALGKTTWGQLLEKSKLPLVVVPPQANKAERKAKPIVENPVEEEPPVQNQEEQKNPQKNARPELELPDKADALPFLQYMMREVTMRDGTKNTHYASMMTKLDELVFFLGTKVGENLEETPEDVTAAALARYQTVGGAVARFLSEETYNNASTKMRAVVQGPPMPNRHRELGQVLLKKIARQVQQVNNTKETAKNLLVLATKDATMAGMTWAEFWEYCQPKAEAPPVVEKKAEELEKLPVEEKKAEELEKLPVVEKKAEELEKLPVEEKKAEELEKLPVVEKKAEELEEIPVVEKKAEELEKLPVEEKKAEEQPVAEQKEPAENQTIAVLPESEMPAKPLLADNLDEIFQILRKTNMVLHNDDEAYHLLFGVMDELVFLNSARMEDTDSRTPEAVIDELIQKYTRLQDVAKQYWVKQEEKAAKGQQAKAAKEEAARQTATWEIIQVEQPANVQPNLAENVQPKPEAFQAKTVTAEKARLQQAVRTQVLAAKALGEIQKMRRGALIYYKNLDLTQNKDLTWGKFWGQYAANQEDVYGKEKTLAPAIGGGLNALMEVQEELQETKRKLHLDSTAFKAVEEGLYGVVQTFAQTMPGTPKEARGEYFSLLNRMDELRTFCRMYVKGNTVGTSKGIQRQTLVHKLLLVLGTLNVRMNAMHSAVLEGFGFQETAGNLGKETWETFILSTESHFRPKVVMAKQGNEDQKDRMDQVLEVLEGGMQKGLGFNADVYRHAVNTLRNIQRFREGVFTGDLASDIQRLRKMEQLYAALKEDCRVYTGDINGLKKHDGDRTLAMTQLLAYAEEDGVLIEGAHQRVLSTSPEAKGTALTWDEVFAQRQAKTSELGWLQNGQQKIAQEGEGKEGDWKWEANDKIPALTKRTKEAYIDCVKTRHIDRMKADASNQKLVLFLEKWSAEEMVKETGDGVVFVQQHLAGAVLEEKQIEMLVAGFKEIKSTGQKEYDKAMRFSAVPSKDTTKNTTRRRVAAYRVARLLGIEKLVAASHAMDKPAGGASGVVTQVVRDDFAPAKAEARPEVAQGQMVEENTNANANKGQPLEIHSNMKRQVVCLQMFDALCGLPLRNLAEFTLKGNAADENSSMMATGNDFAFDADAENVVMRKMFLYQLNADDAKKKKQKKSMEKVEVVSGLAMQYYDHELAEHIVKLSEADVLFALKGCVTQKEIDAFMKRLAQMKKTLQRYMNDPLYEERFLKKEAWPNASEDRMDSVLYYSKVKTKLALGQKGAVPQEQAQP